MLPLLLLTCRQQSAVRSRGRTLQTRVLGCSDDAVATACCCHCRRAQVLQDKYEGFLSPQVQDDFTYYADVAFKQ